MGACHSLQDDQATKSRRRGRHNQPEKRRFGKGTNPLASDEGSDLSEDPGRPVAPAPSPASQSLELPEPRRATQAFVDPVHVESDGHPLQPARRPRYS